MRDNPVQFAVVREDPEIEAALVRRSGARRALLIGSGGCTALSLRVLFPNLELTLVDPNPAQLALVAEKERLLADGAPRERFNVGNDSAGGLNACGNFESLFRGLRDFVREFVLAPPELAALLSSPDDAKLSSLFSHRYWRTAFDLYFSDALLNTMFGPDATRYAEPGSYPRYFQAAFARGLRRSDAATNYFLHHVFLGHYLDLPDCLPVYLREGSARPTRPSIPFQTIAGTIDAVDDFGRFDLIALSNIFDWTDRAQVAAIAARIRREARPGATVVFRQLNNPTDFAALFAPEFRFDRELAAALLAADRSLFYSVLSVGTKGEPS